MDKRTKTSKSNLGQYTKPKWNLGKTTAIRIPEKIKDKVLEFAEKLDNGNSESEKNLTEVIEQLKWAIQPRGEGGGFDGRKSKELQLRVAKAIAQLEKLNKRQSD